MNTNNLLLAILVLLLLVELVQFANNLLIVRRNYKNFERENDQLRNRVKELDNFRRYDQAFIADLMKTGGSTDALVISPLDGIQVLPKDWRVRLTPPETKKVDDKIRAEREGAGEKEPKGKK